MDATGHRRDAGHASLPGKRLAAMSMVAASVLIPVGAQADVAGLAGGRIGPVAYGVYRPVSVPEGERPPLVMVLHGCRQDAVDMRRLARFDALADAHGFVVVYPQAEADAGNPLGCWPWWEPENLSRNRGVSGHLVEIIERVAREAPADERRVYVAGFSSGAAMAGVLAALYPERIAAAGVHSGVSFAAAGSAACGLAVMRNGPPDPGGRGRIAYHAQGARHRVVPAMVIQGEADDRVRPVNVAGIADRFVATNDLADDGALNGSFPHAPPEVHRVRPPGRPAVTVTDYADEAGRQVLTTIIVAGMGHAWSGGSTESRYGDPRGPDASRLLWEFFSRWSLDDPSSREDSTAECRDRRASNFAHYWWYRTMPYSEYACDPWRASWRRSYDDTWAPGRCP